MVNSVTPLLTLLAWQSNKCLSININKDLDLDKLSSCDNATFQSTKGLPGLMCSGSCRWLGLWCRPTELGVAAKCGELDGRSTNDKELYSNQTIWSQHPCGEVPWGRLKRCEGSNPGQCIFEINWGKGKGGKYSCSDHSSNYLTLGSGDTCSTEEGSFQCQKDNATVCLPPQLKYPTLSIHLTFINFLLYI